MWRSTTKTPMAKWMFRYLCYVIKGGQVAVEEGDIKMHGEGHEFVVPAHV